MNVLDKPISIFANYNTAGNPKATTLRQFLTSTKYREVVEKIRAIDDKAQRDKLKSTLPAITASGLFSYRAADCLQEHSGLICLDIDHKGNEAVGNFFDLKAQLVKIPNVAFCIKSVSGKGYAVGIPIAKPEHHGQHFDALKRIFSGFGVEVDKACRDVTRLRGYSYDAEVYLNDAASILTVYDKPQPTAHRPPKRVFVATNDNARFDELVNEICRHSIDITSDYGAWFGVGCALANELGESGRDYYHQLSQFHPKYNQVDTDRQFAACMRKGGKSSTLGLVFSMAESHGIVLPPFTNAQHHVEHKPCKPQQNGMGVRKLSHTLQYDAEPQQEDKMGMLNLQPTLDAQPVPLSVLYDAFYISNEAAAVKLKQYSKQYSL